MTAPRVAHVTTVDLTLRFLLLGQLRALRDAGFDVTAISAPGPWASQIEAEGIHYVPWRNATRSWSPTADAKAFRELVSIFKKGRFDLVHTHNPKPGVMGRIAARVAGVPAVANTVHGLYATDDDRTTKRLAVFTAEWIASRFSDLELYQSEEDLAKARRLGLAPRWKLELLGNGTDLARFDPSRVSSSRSAELRKELEIPDGALVVVAIGRLVAEKGYRELFRAARTIRATRPDVYFVIAGDADPAKPDSLPAGEIEAAGKDCVFVGWREDVEEVLALADIFVLASWREGMPRSAIEAAALQKAMVLTDIRGCREVARHEKEALLVPPRDEEALTRAISVLVEDEGLRTRLAEAARARAVELFDEKRIAGIVVEHSSRLVSEKNRVRLVSEKNREARDDVYIRNGHPRDAGTLARMHREAMPAAFLPRLGDGFMTQLYRSLMADPSSVVRVAERSGRIEGFVAGVLSVKRFYARFYRRRGVLAGVLAAPRLLRPSILKGLRETARYPSIGAELPDAELLSIAVVGDARREGLGRELAVGLIDELRRRGAPAIKVVVAEDNKAANEFYQAVGFRDPETIWLHRDAPSNVWVMGTG